MRQWFYTASKLDQALHKRSADKSRPSAALFRLLHPLVSNHPGLIQWFDGRGMDYNLDHIENVRNWDHLAYQALLALRGDWKRLEQRSTVGLAYLQGTKSKAKYIPDQMFYLALARHDLPGMETALEQLTQPRLIRSRGSAESGYTEHLIFTPAVIYAKIAWLHGSKVRMASPLVPAEWLPMEPLSHYEEAYPFLSPH